MPYYESMYTYPAVRELRARFHREIAEQFPVTKELMAGWVNKVIDGYMDENHPHWREDQDDD